MSEQEPSDQLRLIGFIAITLAIFLVWSHFYKPPVAPPAQPSQGTPQVIAPAQAGAAETTTAPVITAPAGRTKAQAIQATEEKTVVVESALYRVELSNRGAVIESWQLKKYLDDQKPPRPLDLVNADSSKQLGWPFSLMLEDAQLETQANTALYDITPRAEHFAAPAEIRFRWSDGHLDVTKKLKFGEGYETSVETSVTLDGKPLPNALAWRGGFGDKAVSQASQLVSVFYKVTGKLNLLQYKKLGVSGNQSQPFEQTGPVEFAGIEDQFFTAAFLPNGTDLSVWHWTQDHQIIVEDKPATEPEPGMAAGTKMGVPLRLRVYVGPKDLDVLAQERPALDELVQFGWTGIIAKPLLFALRWLHRYIPNYGWAIVVLTLVINTALFPLKMKSWRSMQKMQKVGPEIRSIQDRYKKYSFNDPRKRKMNEEVMAIYNREGINPMGSCLPMLFQMPIWWALWRVLNGAIELRHAPWILWIHDLSAKDPYYILPISMTITMYLMTKMTPQTTVDPAQQRMMTFMPLFMGFIFFRLSSGLNLYMFTSNLVGVSQQVYLNRTAPLSTKGKFKKRDA
jgi:YidC/Oxa1 family membrane protein insertase